MPVEQSNCITGRIMIVDDDTGITDMLSIMLDAKGYKTKSFNSGAEAIEILKDQEFDLLITDLEMPDMNGIELLRAGIEIDPNLTCIVMTGSGSVETAVEAMKTGAFDYILKPFKISYLLPVLTRAMHVRKLRTENMQLRETIAIHELGKAIALSSDLDSIMNKVADAALSQCDADEVSIMLPTEDGKELYIAVLCGGTGTEHIGMHVPLEQGIAGWVARNKELVVLQGEINDPRFVPIKPRSDIYTAVSIPMMSSGKLVGVLNVNITKKCRRFTIGQIKALGVLVSIISPILEKIQLYLQIREGEEKYRSIFENMFDGIYQRLPDGKLIAANPALVRILSYDSPQDLMENITNPYNQLFINPDDYAEIKHVMEIHGEVQNLEYQIYRKDKTKAWVSINARAIRDKNGVLRYHEGILSDISKRKEAEQQLVKERNMLNRIMKTSPSGIMVIDGNGKIIFANKRVREVFNLPKEKIDGSQYDSRAWCITDLDGNPISDENLPINKVLASGKPVYGARVIMTLTNDRPVYLFVNAAPVIEKSGCISEVVITFDDITQQCRNEKKIIETIGKLRKSLDDTILAMAMIVEKRDPYTAGHQERVAGLAVAIAKNINLSEKQINGIRMAGIIHDIGKMSIPSEILSKPSKLSDFEFALVKQHAETGYNILETINFPYPVAQIVYQHHERLDGSGYPRGLKGNNILLDARILAVADVVEAISSHRPYRPALGIDKAMEEISENKGILYDPAVADACLKLFNENSYII